MCNVPEKDVSEVIPNLWLGNIKSAYNKEFLNANKIKNILTVMDEFDNKYKYDDITYIVFPIKDTDVCTRNIISTFDVATFYILNSIKNNEAILIHCKRGHHRSAAIVAAFIIKYLKVDFQSTIAYINKLRPCALVRKTCMTDKLFNYYLHVNNIKVCDKSCGWKNKIYVCECKK